MKPSLTQRQSTPEFTAARSLERSTATYLSASLSHAHNTALFVTPQLGRGLGGGFGAANSCDGCATFSFVGCQMDCGADAACRHGCFIRSLECDLCSLDGFAFGGSFAM